MTVSSCDGSVEVLLACDTCCQSGDLSKAADMIMHQYGITNITKHDAMTLLWLYRFDIGLTEPEILAKYSSYNATDIDMLVSKLMAEKSGFQKELENTQPANNKDLIKENENIGELKKYLLELNNIKINYKSPDIKNKPPSN